MQTPRVKDLIKAGFHFGHRTSRWNPRMAPFIFKRRNQIHIIDLRATLRGLVKGRMLAQAVASHGHYMMFVGTKKQASEVVAREARRCDMPYVSERWPGGLLTNYVTIRKRLDRLAELEELERSGQINLYANKMVSALRREQRKILRNLGGVRDMDRLPSLLIIVDPAREHIAVKEAVKLGIPIVALTDTDGNPDNVDVVVPGNDDSFGAIEIFFRMMSDAVLAGVGGAAQTDAAEPRQQEAVPSSDAAPEPEQAAEEEPSEPAEEQPSETAEEEPSEAAEEAPEAADEPPEAADEEPPEAADEEPPEAADEPSEAADEPSEPAEEANLASTAVSESPEAEPATEAAEQDQT